MDRTHSRPGGRTPRRTQPLLHALAKPHQPPPNPSAFPSCAGATTCLFLRRRQGTTSRPRCSLSRSSRPHPPSNPARLSRWWRSRPHASSARRRWCPRCSSAITWVRAGPSYSPPQEAIGRTNTTTGSSSSRTTTTPSRTSAGTRRRQLLTSALPPRNLPPDFPTFAAARRRWERGKAPGEKPARTPRSVH